MSPWTSGEWLVELRTSPGGELVWSLIGMSIHGNGVRDFESGNNPGYQGMVALRDQDLETGCHLTLPGCTHFLKQWTLERRLEKVSKSKKSFRAEEDDPLLRYMQPVPLQQGEMVIWSCAQLHGSTHNHSNRMRLTQYIRMFPAKEAGLGHQLWWTRWFQLQQSFAKSPAKRWVGRRDAWKNATGQCWPMLVGTGKVERSAVSGKRQ